MGAERGGAIIFEVMDCLYTCWAPNRSMKKKNALFFLVPDRTCLSFDLYSSMSIYGNWFFFNVISVLQLEQTRMIRLLFICFILYLHM